MIIANPRAPNIGDMFSYKDIEKKNWDPQHHHIYEQTVGLFSKLRGLPATRSSYPAILKKDLSFSMSHIVYLFIITQSVTSLDNLLVNKEHIRFGI